MSFQKRHDIQRIVWHHRRISLMFLRILYISPDFHLNLGAAIFPPSSVACPWASCPSRNEANEATKPRPPCGASGPWSHAGKLLSSPVISPSNKITLPVLKKSYQQIPGQPPYKPRTSKSLKHSSAQAWPGGPCTTPRTTPYKLKRETIVIFKGCSRVVRYKPRATPGISSIQPQNKY